MKSNRYSIAILDNLDQLIIKKPESKDADEISSQAEHFLSQIFRPMSGISRVYTIGLIKKIQSVEGLIGKNGFEILELPPRI